MRVSIYRTASVGSSPAARWLALLLGGGVLGAGACGPGPTDLRAYKNAELPIEERIDDLLPRMSPQEKVHQLATLFPNANVRLGIPHLKSAEALHGVTIARATSFPQATALGSTWDPPLIQRMAGVIAREARAVGVHQVYSPMIGVALDPRWGRSEESYGEDPYLVSRIGVAFINGLQGVGPERFDDHHIIATAKHYVADGQPVSGINSTDMDVSERRLHEIFLPPFRAAVEVAGVGSIMPAHHAVNGVLMHANHELMVDLLRDTYGFDGHVVSDNNDIRRLHTLRAIAPTRADAARRALEVGVDQELSIESPWAERYYGPSLLGAVEAGEIPQELVDRAVRNVLRSKFRLGLFDDGTPIAPWQDYLVGGDEGSGPIDGYSDYQEVANTSAVRGIDEPLNEYFNKLQRLGIRRDGWQDVLEDPASDALALEVARKAIILLKNDGELLPLDANGLRRVAVIGPNADAEVLGGYSTPEARHFVTVLEGIREVLGNAAEVEYVEGVSITDYADGRIDTTRENIDAAVAAAHRAEVAIMVIGGNELTAKENEDSDDITLPGRQLQLVRAVHATGTPVVVVLLHGRPLAIPWVADNIPAILDGWYLGQETGTAVAETLFGAINPGGKLTVSIPRNVGQIPVYYNKPPARQARYRDSPTGPLFSFGHGLSYTTFEYADLQVISESGTERYGDARLTVTNVGTRPGDEVVQLYVHDQFASVARPVMELKGFQRLTLEPGQSATLDFPIAASSLAFYDPVTDGWVIEPGAFDIMVGSSSADIRLTGVLDVSTEAIARCCHRTPR